MPSLMCGGDLLTSHGILEASRRMIRSIAVIMAVLRSNVTARTIRAPCGRGCWGPSRWHIYGSTTDPEQVAGAAQTDHQPP